VGFDKYYYLDMVRAALPSITLESTWGIWLTRSSTEYNSGIIAGSLPALKPLFQRLLEKTYAVGTRYKIYDSNSYRLRSFSQTGGKKPSYHSGIHSGIDTVIGRAKHQVTIAERMTKDNSSEESILPIQGPGIMRTTEVVISSSKDTDTDYTAQGCEVHVAEDHV
jgi:hypothetical protein